MCGMNVIRTTAIVLAAGQGKRMQSSVRKQYLLIGDKPVLYYSLKAFEDSIIDDLVLVVGEGEEDYCQRELIDKYGFAKFVQWYAAVGSGITRLHMGSERSAGSVIMPLFMTVRVPLWMIRSSTESMMR